MPITGKLPGTYTAQFISSNEVLYSIKKKKDATANANNLNTACAIVAHSPLDIINGMAFLME